MERSAIHHVTLEVKSFPCELLDSMIPAHFQAPSLPLILPRPKSTPFACLKSPSSVSSKLSLLAMVPPSLPLPLLLPNPQPCLWCLPSSPQLSAQLLGSALSFQVPRSALVCQSPSSISGLQALDSTSTCRPIGSTLPRLHHGPSSLRLCQTPSFLRLHLGQSSFWLLHGLLGLWLHLVPPGPLAPPGSSFAPAPPLSSHWLHPGLPSPRLHLSSTSLRFCLGLPAHPSHPGSLFPQLFLGLLLFLLHLRLAGS